MAEEHDDDLDVGSLRSVISSMRDADEEPPMRGLDTLMAAAKQHAPKTKKPWFKRPPVMAFASIAILIGGAFVIARPDAPVEKVAPSAAPIAPPAPAPDQGNDQQRAAPVTESAIGGAVEKPRPIPAHKVAKPRGRLAPELASPKRDVMPAGKPSTSEMMLESIAVKAASAAARGDCETAKALGTRAAAANPAFYTERIAPKIASCL